MNNHLTNRLQITASHDLLHFLSKSAHTTSRLKAYLHLLGLRVSHAGDVNQNGRSYHLDAGQAIISGSQLADQWDWDRKTVQTYLKGLLDLGYISIQSVPYGQIITFHHLVDVSPSPAEAASPSAIGSGSPSSSSEPLPLVAP